jgi:uncharacterized membrane protein YbhN (UPF0104 family)
VSGRVVLRWAIGLAIVGVLVLGLDPSGVAAQLASADLSLVAVGVLGLTGVHVLGAAAWRSLSRRLAGTNMTWTSAIRTFYAAQAIGGLTPANLGSDAFRVVAVRDAGAGVRVAALPVVVQRATSYLALSLLAAVALLAVSRPAGFTAGVTVGALAVSAIAVAVMSLVTARDGPLGAIRARLIGDVAIGRRALAGSVVVGIGIGLVFHATAVFLTWLIVLAVEPGAARPAALAAVALARLSLAVPLTPSGLGIQEAALAGLFVGIGLPPESAVAAGLLSRLSLVLTTAIGTLAWSGMGRPRVDTRQRRNADPASSHHARHGQTNA